MKIVSLLKSVAHISLMVVVIIAGAYYVDKLVDHQHAVYAKQNINKIDEPLNPIQTDHNIANSHQETLTPDYTIPEITDGYAPVISRIPTKQPVVFLGIDDGQNKQKFELHMMRVNHIKASLFLSDLFIHNDPLFFKPFMQSGSMIENHSLSHELFSKMSYEQQKYEICTQADLIAQEFGRRPILFRPPGGDYNQDTQKAAAACGMKAVVLWVAKANGGTMQYQIGNKLQAGDIVLMHFRPEFKADMQAFLNAQKAAGLHTELLENWLAAN